MVFDPLFEIQRMAPTQEGGGHHAGLRELLKTHDVGEVTVQTSAGKKLGATALGGVRDGRVVVEEDGLGHSGSPVYTPLGLHLKNPPETIPIDGQPNQNNG